MSTLDDWIVDACDALGLPVESMTNDVRDDLLDLTRDAAHGIARVAGPLTTYLVGLAVAGGTPPSQAIRRLSELVATRYPQTGDGGDQTATGSAPPGPHQPGSQQQPGPQPSPGSQPSPGGPA